MFEDRFAADRMARDYLRVYRTLVAGGPDQPSVIPGPLAMNVSTLAVVTVVFAQSMDGGSINSGTFTVSIGGNPIAGRFDAGQAT